MIEAAFYAPMKPPDHPRPSGDRTMARALVSALSAAGVRPTLASSFCARDAQGDLAVQNTLVDQAQVEIDRLLSSPDSNKWRLWVTYHNYYKAPDLIGPAVCAKLGIPYVLIEATRAKKRLTGAWARFAKAAEKATDAADLVFFLTERDGEALRAHRPKGQFLAHLPPFLPTSVLPPETRRTAGLLSVGMMRAGDKLASYRLVADSLALLRSTDWQLQIAGDGPARAEVSEAMSPFGDRVKFLGALTEAQLGQAYAQAQVLVWPGVNEAFGMTYLEAQAAGLTVVAQDRPGVRDVLAPGAVYPSPEAGPKALAERLDFLLSMPKLTMHLGASARAHVGKTHMLTTAAATLRAHLKKVLE